MSESASHSGSEPVHCAGCRQAGSREDLERFVFHESVGLLFDMRGGAPGPEAWLHPLPGCIGPACWSGFSRAFERPIASADAGDLLAELRGGIGRRVAERINDARRLGEAEMGRQSVKAAALEGRIELVLVGPHDEDFAAQLEEETACHVVTDLPAELLEGELEDMEPVIGFARGERAEQIGRDVEKLICLEEDAGAVKRG